MLNRFNQKQRVSQSTQNARAFSTREPTLFREVVATGKPMRGHLSPHSFDRRLHLEIILTLDTIYLGSAELLNFHFPPSSVLRLHKRFRLYLAGSSYLNLRLKSKNHCTTRSF